jgi:glycosyltransferase involved in cell wall biosynthesis
VTKPKVLFVTHSPAVSGAEYVLLTIAANWRGAGAFLFEDGPLRPALASRGIGVKVSRWGRGFNVVKRDGSLTKALPLLSRLIATVLEMAKAGRRSDIVYANSQKAFTIAAIAKVLHRRPMIWHLHDILDPAHFGAGQVRMQVRLANRFANRVIVPSRAAQEGFVTQGGRLELVQVVPNGIECTARDPASRAELRVQLDLPDAPLVGVFSRLAPWKGQHDVLAAVSRLPAVHCLIVGSALFDEDAYEVRLRALVDELCIGDRVHFLGQRSDVRKLMQAVDLVVHPSTAPEPFGLTLVEAMSVRTPVVATDIGASREIFADGECGFLVPPSNPDALASTMAEILRAGPGLERVTRQAAARFDERYRAEHMHDAIDAVVEEIAHHAVA